MKKIITFFTGERAKGESLPQPTKRTVGSCLLKEEDWFREMRAGMAYGRMGDWKDQHRFVISKSN